MVCLGFLSYSTNIDLPFRAPNFNLWVGGFLCHFKKKNKQWRYNHAPEEENIHVFRGFSIFFFFWNSSNMKLPLSFNKNKVVCRGVFVVFIWFYCKYHVGSRVIGYLYVYKLLFMFRNGWSMLSKRCPHHLGGACDSKKELSTAFRAGLDAPRHPRHNGMVLVRRRPTKKLRLGFFCPSLSPPRKLCCPLQKPVGKI
jgi:hypothetical protein